jgi:hypothetical protein
LGSACEFGHSDSLAKPVTDERLQQCAGSSSKILGVVIIVAMSVQANHYGWLPLIGVGIGAGFAGCALAGRFRNWERARLLDRILLTLRWQRSF